MANITLLHELQMFAKTSGKKMTVFEAVKEYYGRVLDDTTHLSASFVEEEEEEDYYDVVPEGALPPYAPFAHEDLPF